MTGLILTVGGTRYAGWSDVVITRGIDRAAASFSIGLTDPWLGQQDKEGATLEAWAILAGSEVELSVLPGSGDVEAAEILISGYVDAIEATLDGKSRRLRIDGRSRTSDLVDCSAWVEGGRFSDQTLEQMARLLAEQFGVKVVVETDTGAAFPAVQIETGETVHALLTRLARHRGVLITDQPDGSLLLTRPGAGRATDALAEGTNLVGVRATVNLADRYSSVTVRGQRAGGGASELTAEAVREDPAIERHRPLIVVAEEQVDDQSCDVRAEMEIRRRAGAGTQAIVTVAGWHMSDGSLWRVGDVVSIKSPSVGLERDLVIGGATFRLTKNTHLTELQLAPTEAFSPDEPTSESAGGSESTDVDAAAAGDANSDFRETLRAVSRSIGRDV